MAGYARQAKVAADKKHELAEEPLRRKLSEYTDECINLQWTKARGMDYYNSPELGVAAISHVNQCCVEGKWAGMLSATEQLNEEGSKQGSPVPDALLSPVTKGLHRSTRTC